MTGETLLNADIRRMTIESSLLSAFSSAVLNEASYDIRVGKTAIVVLPAQQQGYVRIDIEQRHKARLTLTQAHPCLPSVQTCHILCV